MFETDYPYPTSMAPGPQTAAVRPRDYAERALADVSDDTIGKVLHDNAAVLYGLSDWREGSRGAGDS